MGWLTSKCSSPSPSPTPVVAFVLFSLTTIRQWQRRLRQLSIMESVHIGGGYD
jgi:hypothetical protein